MSENRYPNFIFNEEKIEIEKLVFAVGHILCKWQCGNTSSKSIWPESPFYSITKPQQFINGEERFGFENKRHHLKVML